MFKKNDKKYLYWIIECYISNKITGAVFCDAFYNCYDLELNHKSLSEDELRIFEKLDFVVERYTPFKEDILRYPDIYSSDEQLRTAVQNAKDELPFEFVLDKYAIRFLCSFFELYSAYISKVEIRKEEIKGIICYEYDEQTQEFLWHYPMDKRIKSAIELLEFVNKRQLNQGEKIIANKKEMIQLLIDKEWSENRITDTLDYILNLNIQMIDEGFVTNRFTIHF